MSRNPGAELLSQPPTHPAGSAGDPDSAFGGVSMEVVRSAEYLRDVREFHQRRQDVQRCKEPGCYLIPVRLGFCEWHHFTRTQLDPPDLRMRLGEITEDWSAVPGTLPSHDLLLPDEIFDWFVDLRARRSYPIWKAYDYSSHMGVRDFQRELEARR